MLYDMENKNNKKVEVINLNQIKLLLEGIDTDMLMDDVNSTVKNNSSVYMGELGTFTGKMHDSKYLNDYMKGASFIYMTKENDNGYNVLIARKNGYKPVPL